MDCKEWGMDTLMILLCVTSYPESESNHLGF